MKHSALLALALSLAPIAAAAPSDAPTLGDAAPELVVDAPDGVLTDWGSMRGDVVVVEFWATWCAPCIPALDHLGALAGEFEGRDVRFLSVVPESAERIGRFLERHDVAFPVLLDREGATFDAYGVRVVPTTIIIDAEGKLAARTRPEDVTSDVLESILAGRDPGLDVVHDVESNIEWVPDGSDEGDVFARLVIAPSEARSGGTRFQPGSGKITGDGVHRNNLIQVAYDMPHTRIVNRLSPWSREDPVWKVSVLAPAGDDDLARRMLARSIEVKFQFRAGFEDREADVFVLTQVDGAEVWAESTAPAADQRAMSYGGGIQHVGQPLDKARGWFENMLQMPVIDETGLTGSYDIEMDWVDGDTFNTELARIGLQLTAARRPVTYLTVDPR